MYAAARATNPIVIDDGRHCDGAVAAVRRVQERVRIPAVGGATDERQAKPDDRVGHPGDDVATRQAHCRRIDEPVEDDDHREQLVDDDVDPDQTEPHVDVRQERDHDHERDRQVGSSGATKRLQRVAARGAAIGDEPRKRRNADQVALDREVGEEPGRVEGVVVRELDRLGDDRDDDDDDRCRPRDQQDPVAFHPAPPCAANRADRSSRPGQFGDRRQGHPTYGFAGGCQCPVRPTASSMASLGPVG